MEVVMVVVMVGEETFKPARQERERSKRRSGWEK